LKGEYIFVTKPNGLRLLICILVKIITTKKKFQKKERFWKEKALTTIGGENVSRMENRYPKILQSNGLTS